MALTIEELCAVPRWPLDRTLALAGTVRGDTLGPWGQNLEKRFGAGGLARVRARLPRELASIAPVLGDRDRVPVYAQLVVTEAIVDELLGEQILALLPLLVEDTRAGIGRLRHAAIRIAGVARLLERGPSAFRDIHERGEHEVSVARNRAELRFFGSPLFGHPTWRVLQVLGTLVLFELAGTTGNIAAEPTGDDAFTAIARW